MNISKFQYSIDTAHTTEQVRDIAKIIYRQSTAINGMNEICTVCDYQATCKSFRNWHVCIDGIVDYLMKLRHKGVDNREKISKT